MMGRVFLSNTMFLKKVFFSKGKEKTMSSPYFLLHGAYSEASLYNSPNPIQDIHYPCLVSYPFLSDYSHAVVDTSSLPTDYESISHSYPSKPCAYCSYYEKR